MGASKLASAKCPHTDPIEDSLVRKILRINRNDALAGHLRTRERSRNKRFPHSPAIRGSGGEICSLVPRPCLCGSL